MKPLRSEQTSVHRSMRTARQWRKVMVSSILLSLGLSIFALGQNHPSTLQREQLASIPKGLPSDVLIQAQVLGNRMGTPGKEETVLSGQLVDAAGNPKTIHVVHQISGMVRIERSEGSVPLVFDGDFSRGFADRNDESLLETFVMDTVEGMLYSIRSGGAVRLLGRRFGPDPRVERDYKGPWYDIYEVTAPVRSSQDKQLRMKRYYFDSDTGFLLSTRYTDPTVSPGLKVETRFSGWGSIDGSAYPGRIERYEDGRRIFTIVIKTASSSARQDASQFR